MAQEPNVRAIADQNTLRQPTSGDPLGRLELPWDWVSREPVTEIDSGDDSAFETLAEMLGIAEQEH
jgi:hypothetical protein